VCAEPRRRSGSSPASQRTPASLRPLRESASDFRSVLAERDVRLLLGAQWLAQAADGLAQATFADYVVLEPGSQGGPARILAVFALTLLPYSLVAPFLGVFVDRWARRALLVWTNVARATLLLAVSLPPAGLPSIPWLLGGALTLLGLGRLFLTTKSAVLPVVLHERELLKGNAVSGGAGMIAALLGGVLGLAALSVLRPVTVLLIAGAAYLGAGITARGLSKAMRHETTAAESLGAAIVRVARALVAGLLELYRRPRARLSLAGIFILRSAVMLVAIGAILVIRDSYPDAGDRFGRISAGALALGTSSVGAFVGAVTTPALGRRLGNAGLVLLGFAVSGVGIALLGGVPDLRALLSLTALGGFGAYVAKIATEAQIQESVPDEFRGRAFSVYDILYNLASVAAAAVVLVFSGVAFRAVLLAAGVVTLVLAAFLGAAMRRAGMLARSGAGPSPSAPGPPNP
jgi:MFS family permease